MLGPIEPFHHSAKFYLDLDVCFVAATWLHVSFADCDVVRCMRGLQSEVRCRVSFFPHLGVGFLVVFF